MATAYSASILTVWHASFAFTRSTLRAEIAAGATSGGPSPEALLAFSTYAVPLFRVGLAIAGIAFLVVFCLILSGRTLYPRWAAAWNIGGAALFALSTVLLWNREVI